MNFNFPVKNELYGLFPCCSKNRVNRGIGARCLSDSVVSGSSENYGGKY